VSAKKTGDGNYSCAGLGSIPKCSIDFSEALILRYWARSGSTLAALNCRSLNLFIHLVVFDPRITISQVGANSLPLGSKHPSRHRCSGEARNKGLL